MVEGIYLVEAWETARDPQRFALQLRDALRVEGKLVLPDQPLVREAVLMLAHLDPNVVVVEAGIAEKFSKLLKARRFMSMLKNPPKNVRDPVRSLERLQRVVKKEKLPKDVQLAMARIIAAVALVVKRAIDKNNPLYLTEFLKVLIRLFKKIATARNILVMLRDHIGRGKDKQAAEAGVRDWWNSWKKVNSLQQAISWARDVAAEAAHSTNKIIKRFGRFILWFMAELFMWTVALGAHFAIYHFYDQFAPIIRKFFGTIDRIIQKREAGEEPEEEEAELGITGEEELEGEGEGEGPLGAEASAYQVQAILKQLYRKETKRKEWALVSKSNPKKVLKWFGARKPSKERVLKEERRIQYFKHKGG